MSETVDLYNLVVDIQETLQAILGVLQQSAPASVSASAEVADDRDLDGKYGDPQVKFNPRDWHGDSCKGLTMSQCPAEFLDLLAGTFDYFAKQAEQKNETTSAGKPVAPYKRKDAARARGWAARKRNGWKGAAVAASPFETFETGGFVGVAPADFDDADVPF